jgi:chemotaxis protein MotB
MATEQPAKAILPLVVVRRSKKGGHGAHHGGAWKIAYADFVTAMMAFFLLMWLLGSTTKGEKQGIADYFNTPLSVSMSGQGTGGMQSSILTAGGRDITSTEQGDGKATQPSSKTVRSGAQPTLALPRPAADSADAENLRKMKAKLSALIDRTPKLLAFKDQIRIDITSAGLRIEIVDSLNRPMFASGSRQFEPYAAEILRLIGTPLNDVDNRVSITGHTDALTYSHGDEGFSNWELSSARANAARRELIAGGMQESKVIEVRGLADVLPLHKGVLDEPANRRISILLVNRATERAFFRDGGRVVAQASGTASEAAVAVADKIEQDASHMRGETPAKQAPAH